MTETGIIKLENATRMLAEIRTIDGARKLIDLAEAARVYARKVELGLEAQNHAAEIKLRAQRRAGEILDHMKDTGERQTEGGDRKSLLQDETMIPPTLDDLGIDRVDAHRWQTIASLPEEMFEAFIDETKAEEKELTTAAVYREAKAELNRQELDQVIQDGIDIRVPEGKFKTIVIDPPWKTEKILREVAPNQVGFDYPTMTLDELHSYEVPWQLADDDCHLFLWATQKYLPDAYELLVSWGFKYIFTMVWHKAGGFQPFNLPQYNCEFVVYGRKGSPEFIDTKNFFTCFDGERRGHSQKPKEFYQLVERVCAGPRIDVFSREKHEGFEQYGYEPDKYTE